jgi:hypothetical protein
MSDFRDIDKKLQIWYVRHKGHFEKQIVSRETFIKTQKGAVIKTAPLFFVLCNYSTQRNS